ncbi:hypothetical protein GF325_04230, partial [Candidatus Bathyarchaeota archaeon]|nr:hypothetical protein [Candidatus Bathyarchaeota archaeon]
MTADDIDEGDIIHEPRNIIEKDDFSIIPFADQGAIGICYLFNYAPGGKENIQGTI